MPLLKGKENIGKNIKTEEGAGKKHSQAVAIALHTAYDGKKAPYYKPKSGGGHLAHIAKARMGY